jgi:hypothetical protein
MLEQDLNLSHQSLLTPKLQTLNVAISEYSFANLYLFRKVHQYKVGVADLIYIKGTTHDGFTFIMPMDPLPSLKQEDLVAWLSNVHFLFPIPDQWTTTLNSEVFQKNFNENDSDYLYLSEKIRTFTGHNLSKKRNLVKQLMEGHHVQTLSLTKDRKEDALHVLEDWQLEQHSPLETDYSPCKEALQMMETLNLKGEITYVNHQPRAFIIGEQLPPHQYIIHFAKARRDIKGLYQYIYQNLAESLDEQVILMNWEQDLGALPLRKSKRSYQPDRLLTKWRIQLQEA